MLETLLWRRPAGPLAFQLFRLVTALSAGLCFELIIGCSGSHSTEQASRTPSAPYCSARSSTIGAAKIRGLAVYENRANGNGAASDSGLVYSITNYAAATSRTYAVEINGIRYSVESALAGSQAVLDVVAKLKLAINSDSKAKLFAYGISQLNVTAPNQLTSPTAGIAENLNFLTVHSDAEPIRYAEVALLAADGSITACTETSGAGEFEFSVEIGDNRPYTVEVRSRSYNGMNTAYILDSPTTGRFHSIKKSTVANSAEPLVLRARVHDDLKAGAFNILDQILMAQQYLRLATADCDLPTSPNFFAGCVPFTNAPLVNVFWSPGVSPGSYYGSDQAISFYLNGQNELYIQGGTNGNVASSDMDHFDNSVILHEYAHFIEDVFGRPNSPGGAHDGDSIIDPRLAWGEGWADYFQAAVTGIPIYRDTYGTVDCSALCAGAFFNVSIDPAGAADNDQPTESSLAEGNFREFSITRLLWDVSRPGGASHFTEIWRLFVEPKSGMRAAPDPFKFIGSIHALQEKLPGSKNWNPLLIAEEQNRGVASYANPLSLSSSCPTNPVTITPNRGPGDSGSFETSDLLRSNDFYRFDHAGGPLNLELRYEKDPINPIDLDLYIYRPRYVFGRASDILASSALINDGGVERTATALAAGPYLINVYADTSTPTNAPGTKTKYVLRLNGNELCPATTPL